MAFSIELNLSPSLFVPENNFKPFQAEKVYDVIIIGGGPAGLTAAVYCLRKGMQVGLMTMTVGGQVAETAGIENYLGYRYINGMELVDKFREQVLQFGIDFEAKASVASIQAGELKGVVMADGRTYRSRTLIIASGKQYKKLGLPNEKDFMGHGVVYCAICDAPLYAGKKVVVAGGGNSGVAAVLDLVRIAGHVTLVHRRSQLKADQILIDKLSAFKDVDYFLSSMVTQIHGTDRVSGVTVRSLENGRESVLDVDGLFVEIGLIPNSEFVRGVLSMNKFNEINVDGYCRTDVPGICAAGDVTSVPYKQIIVACGEGAKAAMTLADYLQSLRTT
jgi:NADH-dependent peroxiredoxin subunit F